MSDLSITIVGVLLGNAAFLLCVALIGRPDASLPICRKCKRDARPFAWREPRACACGADLSRAGAVRVGRRRSRTLGIVAIVLGLLGIASFAFCSRELARGTTWMDYEPAAMFGKTLGDWSVDSDGSLARRMRDGIAPEAAAKMLDAYAAAPRMTGPLPDFALLDGLIEMARDEGALGQRAVGTMLSIGGSAEFDLSDGSVLVSAQPLPEWVRNHWLFLVNDVRGNGASLSFTIDERAKIGSGDWFRFGAEPPLRARSDLTALPASIDIRGVACRLPCDVRDWVEFARGRGTLDPLKPGVDAIVVPFSATLLIGKAPPRALWWNPWRPDTGRRETMLGLAVVPYASAALGGVVAGIAFACALLFGFAAARGWLGLEPPRCRKCTALLRSRDDQVPEHCPECGADLARPRTIRWIRGRKSVASLLVTLPVVTLGGLALATLFGILTAVGTRAPLVVALAWPTGVVERNFARWLESDDLAIRREGAGALYQWASHGTTSAVFDDNNTLRARERAAVRRCVERLANLSDDAIPHQRIGANPELIPALLLRLISTSEIDLVTAERWLERLAATPTISVEPTIAVTNESQLVSIRFGDAAGSIRQVRLNETPVDGPWNSTSIFVIPEGPGRYSIEVEWHVRVGEGNVISGPSSPFASITPPGEGFGVRGRGVVNLAVTDAAQGTAITVDAPSLDPMTQLGAGVEVSVMPLRSGGEGDVPSLVTLKVKGPLAGLVGAGARGEWQVRANDQWFALQRWTDWRETCGIVMMPTTRDSHADSMHVRWVPFTGERAERALSEQIELSPMQPSAVVRVINPPNPAPPARNFISRDQPTWGGEIQLECGYDGFWRKGDRTVNEFRVTAPPPIARTPSLAK